MPQMLSEYPQNLDSAIDHEHTTITSTLYLIHKESTSITELDKEELAPLQKYIKGTQQMQRQLTFVTEPSLQMDSPPYSPIAENNSEKPTPSPKTPIGQRRSSTPPLAQQELPQQLLAEDSKLQPPDILSPPTRSPVKPRVRGRSPTETRQLFPFPMQEVETISIKAAQPSIEVPSHSRTPPLKSRQSKTPMEKAQQITLILSPGNYPPSSSSKGAPLSKKPPKEDSKQKQQYVRKKYEGPVRKSSRDIRARFLSDTLLPKVHTSEVL